MPRITKHFELEITPERFLEACSILELQELDMLLQSPRYQDKLTAHRRQMKMEFDQLPKNANGQS